jgi:hypothetical protein
MKAVGGCRGNAKRRQGSCGRGYRRGQPHTHAPDGHRPGSRRDAQGPHQGAGSRTCARRTNSLDALLSSGDFQEALNALLGKDAPNLSLLDHCASTRVAAGEHRLDAAAALQAGVSHEVHRIVEAIRRTRRSAGSDHQPPHVDGCPDHQSTIGVYRIGQIVVAEWTHSSLHRLGIIGG